MSSMLQQLIQVYPHIRTAIFELLTPPDVMSICITTRTVLDKHDRGTYLNPTNEVFERDTVNTLPVTTVLIGEDVKLLLGTGGYYSRFHTFFHMQHDVNYVQDSTSVVPCTRVRLPNVTQRYVSKTCHKSIVTSDTGTLVGMSIRDTCIQILRLNSSSTDLTFERRMGSNVEFTLDYYIDCIVSKGTTWRFDKVRVQVTTFDIYGEPCEPNTMYARVTIPLTDVGYVIAEYIS